MFQLDINGLLADVVEITARNDARIERMKFEAARLGMPVSCDGCRSAGCCYQPVATFIAEALLIAKHHPISAGRRQDLIKAGETMENEFKDVFFQAAYPCAFLNEDKTCSIYEQRPGACRRYYVINEPKLCMPGSTKKVSVLNTIDLDNEWVMSMVRMQTKLGFPIEPIMMGALPRMVAIASEVLELPNGRAIRRYLLAQKWMGFDKPMAQVDSEAIAAYSKHLR